MFHKLGPTTFRKPGKIYQQGQLQVRTLFQFVGGAVPCARAATPLVTTSHPRGILEKSSTPANY